MRWNGLRPAGQDTLADHPSDHQPPSASPWGPRRPARMGRGDDPEDGHNLSARDKTPRAAGQATICGVRRKVFFVVISVGLLIALAAIGVGVGAGIAFNKTSSPKTETIVETSSNITCPDSHNAIIKSPSDGADFNVSCGIDYPVSAGASDLATEEAPSMGRCVEICAGTDGCIGVAWGAGGECVLKGSVGASVGAGGMILALRVGKPRGA